MKALSLLTLVSLSILSACTARKVPSDVIRMRLPGEPPSLDWSLATDNVSKEVIQNLQEGLVQQNAESKIVPALAESWTVSPDGLDYVFKIRSDAKWSDGREVKAQDFVDGWERLLNPKTAAEYAYFLFDVVGAEEYQKGTIKDFAKVAAKAVDDHTFSVKLKRPVAYWIYIPSFWVTYPHRKDVIEKYGDKWTEPGHMVTAGPYVLKVWEHDSKIGLEKNPYYAPSLEQPGRPNGAEFRVVKEDSTAIALFDSGALDIVRDLPPIQLPALATRKDFVKSPYLRGFYIGFNVKDPSVADVRVRRALALAIDRSELKAIKALAPMITPTSSWIPTPLLGANESRGVTFDAAAAKKLWDSIPKKPTTMELWFDQKEMHKIVAENLQAQWKRVLGLDVQLTNQEWKVYLKTLKSHTPPMWRMGWGADYPDPDTFMNLFACNSGNDFTKMCNANYDAFVQKASRRGTDAERASAYDSAQKIMLEEQVAIIPLFTQANLHMVTPRVIGFQVNPMGDFEFKNFRLKSEK